MYVLRNEAEVTAGRAIEFEAATDEFVGIQQQNPGCIGATLLQSYGNPGRYTLTTRWTDRAAAREATRGESMTAYVRSLLTSGLFRPTRLTEAYEGVFELDRANMLQTIGESSAERWIDFTIASPIVAPTFEDRIRELAALGLKHAPGIFSVRLRRSMGFDTRYVLLVIAADHAAARGWVLVPEMRAFMERQPLGQVLDGSPSAEIYHVVKRYAGPAQATVEASATAARA
jgi:quinol monooxygenase YgiN